MNNANSKSETSEKVFLVGSTDNWYDCDAHNALSQLGDCSRLLTSKYASVYDASELVELLQQKFKCYYGIFLSLATDIDKETDEIKDVYISWDYISNLNQDRGYVIESDSDAAISKFIRGYFTGLGFPENNPAGFCRKLVEEIPKLSSFFRFE